MHLGSSMSIDDIIYLSLLTISIAIGPWFREIADLQKKQLVSTGLGLLLILLASGLHLVHPLIVTLVNAAIILYCNKKYCHIISFVFCFFYLGFVRIISIFGLPSVPSHTNAIQMMLTLKMVGLANEVHNSYQMKKNADKVSTLEYQYNEINPSFSDIFHYAFCYAGVLIGPYYRFRTYVDMIHAPYSKHVPYNKFLVDRMKRLPLYVFLYFVANYFFPLSHVSSGAIYEDSFWYRVFYMTPSFFQFRMRIYSGFIMGECVCIMAGIGAYPSSSSPQPGKGPSNYSVLDKIQNSPELWPKTTYDFETIHNIYEYGSEFHTTIREGIRSWNQTVQYWLAIFVHRKLPYPKPVRMLITMFVSAFWHGVQPGYYLCLVSAPFFLVVESQVEHTFRKRLSIGWQKVFDWVWWVFKMQSFSYMGMAFLLLSIDTTWKFWRSIYFVGHLIIAGLSLACVVVNSKRQK